jgi:hypothetical protein
MLAQIYTTTNKFENIPEDILNNIDKMGMDECVFLTDLEGKYFNALYQIEEEKYSLFGKQVCFLTGNIGRNKTSKKEYFISERNRLISNRSPLFGWLYIFSDIQKEESGGYDAAIVFYTKKKLSIKEVIKRLKKQRYTQKEKESELSQDLQERDKKQSLVS